MSSLEAQLEEVQQRKTKILEKIDEKNSRKKIKCAVKSCGKLHSIKNLTLIQTHHYVSPHGCTEGDYWNAGEMQFVCPDTKVINRIMLDNDDVAWEDRGEYGNDPESQFGERYASLFKEVIEGYGSSYRKDDEELATDDVTNGRWVNNYYVDKNRKKFGLVERRKEN